MIAEIDFTGRKVKVDLSKPIDISIPLGPDGPRAWYVAPMSIAPVINAHFTGSVALGGSVNFRDVKFNPHGHGTHTETVGHITKENYPLSDFVPDVMAMTKLISITPQILDSDTAFGKKGDKVISKEQIESSFPWNGISSLVVRTTPNDRSKLNRTYSNTNFAYFTPEALAFLVEKNIRHLLTDLPSVDREEDGGVLAAHHAFWMPGGAVRQNCTITEFVFVDDKVPDGEYVLQLQTIAIRNDASPSRPLLFEIL